MPEPSGSKPWRNPDMVNYGGTAKITSSLQRVKGLCQRGRKCFRKAEHDGACYPQDEKETKDG